MKSLFSSQPDDLTDFSNIGAARVFNEQLAPTFNKVESMALDAGLGDLDLDGEEAAAAQRREEQAETDDTFFREQAAQDNEFLGLGATDIFGGEQSEVIPSFLPEGATEAVPAQQDFNALPSGGSSKILTQKNGRVNPRSLSGFIGAQIAQSKLNGFVPKDGARYGITKGTPAEWSRFFTGLAKLESSFKNSTVGDVGRFEGNSNGLFQLSPQDALNHKLKKGKFSIQELQNPELNTKAAIAIAERLVVKDGVIAKGKKGAARYWGPLRRGKNPSKVKF